MRISLLLTIVMALPIYSQHSLDVKAGVSINQSHPGIAEEKMEDFGHGAQCPCLNLVPAGSKKYYSPYINISYVKEQSENLEWHFGLSYLQDHQEVSYYNVTPGTNGYVIGNSSYERIKWKASGQMNYHLFRFEMAAAAGLNNFKASLGFLNFDYGIIGPTTLMGSETHYSVTASKTSFFTGQYSMVPEDSVVTEISSADYRMTWHSYQIYQFPLSIGLEYKFKLKDQTLITGAKAVRAFHKTSQKHEDMLSYSQVIFYTAFRF